MNSTNDNPANNLILYISSTCPYCQKVLTAAKQLNINIELRNINDDTNLTDLKQATGIKMVPCLRIINPNNTETWMHESADIIEYLKNI